MDYPQEVGERHEQVMEQPEQEVVTPEQEVHTPEQPAGQPGLFRYYFPGWARWSAAADTSTSEDEGEAERKIGTQCF